MLQIFYPSVCNEVDINDVVSFDQSNFVNYLNYLFLHLLIDLHTNIALSSVEVIYDHKVCQVSASSLLLNIPKAMKRKITSSE